MTFVRRRHHETPGDSSSARCCYETVETTYGECNVVVASDGTVFIDGTGLDCSIEDLAGAIDALRLEALRLAVEVWRGQGATAQSVLYCAREFEEHLRGVSPSATVKTDEPGQG